MSEPFIGEIRMFAGNFAPRSHAFCDGQLLAVSQNNALFALLGTTYGGDGRITFGLPDLRGRVPIHMGSGPGLSNRKIGAKAGLETVQLSTGQLPIHSHPMQASSNTGNSPNPQGNVLGKSTSIDLYINEAPSVSLATTAITSTTGGGQSHNNIQPFLCIHYIIALVGIFPSRNSPEPSPAQDGGDAAETETETPAETDDDPGSTRRGDLKRSRKSLRRRKRRARGRDWK